MEEHSDIIAAIKRQQLVDPPKELADKIMYGVEKVDQGFTSKIKRVFFSYQQISQETAGVFLGQIISFKQCAFLLLIVGFFYLVAGFAATWGFHDAIVGGNINPWLKIQPYIIIASALFILSAAFLIAYFPAAITLIQYAMIIHTLFILVNALVLESILFFPIALIYVLILTILAVSFSILIIGSIRSVLIFKMISEGGNCA